MAAKKKAAAGQETASAPAAPALEFECLAENLAKGVASVIRVAARRTNLPVLSNILISTEGTDTSLVKIAATDLVTGITTLVGAKVSKPGAITIPAKLLDDTLKAIGTGKIKVTMDAKTQAITIKSLVGRSKLKGLDAAEFPVIAPVSKTAPTLPGDQFAKLVSMTSFAATQDESRPVLQQVRFMFDGDRVEACAADGFRLAVYSITVPDAKFEQRTVLIPALGLSEFLRVMNTDEPVIFDAQKGGRVVLAQDVTEVAISGIEGKYPDISAIVPRESKTTVTIAQDVLRSRLKLVTPIASQQVFTIVCFVKPGDTEKPGTLTIKSVSAEAGEAEGEADATITGPEIEVALNVKYLTEVVNLLEGNVKLGLGADHTQAILVTQDAEPGFKYVLMPMHVGK